MNDHPSIPHASTLDLEPVRVIVFLPQFEVDAALVAQKIRGLVNSTYSRVQLIGLCKDAAQESSLRRQMITLTAMMVQENIPVESKIEYIGIRSNKITSNHCNKDLIVCFAQRQPAFGHNPLKQILESSSGASVYLISGLDHPDERPFSTWVSTALAWIGSIGIIFGFFFLQTRIAQFPRDPIYSSILYASVFAEAGTLWIWNSLTS